MAWAQYRGVVKWFNNAEGYGFLGRDDGKADVFAHYSSIQGGRIKSLKEGRPVEFEIVQERKARRRIRSRWWMRTGAGRVFRPEEAMACPYGGQPKLPPSGEMAGVQRGRRACRSVKVI